MIIENRLVLIVSGGLLLVAAIAGLVLSTIGVSNPTSTVFVVIEALFVVPLAICVFAVCVSFLIHAYRYNNYGWILAFFFLTFVVAYLYGFIVASKPGPNDIAG